MNIVLIAAMAEDGTIGHAGKIPWHIRDDLQRFKRLTMGHPVIMGRKTFESIGRPLPGRRNIVLTRGRPIPGVECFASLDAALRALDAPATAEKPVFIIGGAELYRAALPIAHKLFLTHVKHPGGGDTKFPDFDRSQWREVCRQHGPECTYVEYERLGHLSRHL
jgi:dihydrofolate reductase